MFKSELFKTKFNGQTLIGEFNSKIIFLVQTNKQNTIDSAIKEIIDLNWKKNKSETSPTLTKKTLNNKNG